MDDSTCDSCGTLRHATFEFCADCNERFPTKDELDEEVKPNYDPSLDPNLSSVVNAFITVPDSFLKSEKSLSTLVSSQTPEAPTDTAQKN